MPIDASSGELFLNKIDSGKLNLIKTNKDWSCLMCQKRIARGSFCLGGSSWTKICINCSEAFLNNFLASTKKLTDRALKLKEILKNNMATYLKNNLACALSG